MLALARTSSPTLIAAAAGRGCRRVASFFAGALVDRHSKRRVMISMDLARGASAMVLAVDILAGDSRMWILFPVAAVIGAGTAVFDVAAIASVPSLTDQPYEELTGRLSAYELTGEQLLGPPVGGQACSPLRPRFHSWSTPGRSLGAPHCFEDCRRNGRRVRARRPGHRGVS